MLDGGWGFYSLESQFVKVIFAICIMLTLDSVLGWLLLLLVSHLFCFPCWFCGGGKKVPAIRQSSSFIK